MTQTEQERPPMTITATPSDLTEADFAEVIERLTQAALKSQATARYTVATHNQILAAILSLQAMRAKFAASQGDK